MLYKSPIHEYYARIESGEIIVSEKIRAVYHHILQNIDDPDCPYTYDAAKADRVIQFVEKYCRQSKGKQGGNPIELMLWQSAMIAAIYGMVSKETGLRQYREVLLIVGRKNGKSCLASALGLYHLMKDNEAGPEVYSCATKRDQSKIIWDESKKMIHKSPSLSKRTKTLVSEIKCCYNDGIFKPLSSDTNRLDGLNISCALCDEIHAWKDEGLYHILRDGMSAREQPLLIQTTTAGFIRESIYDRKYNEAKKIIRGYEIGDYSDEKTLPLVYELDNKDEVWDEGSWIKANPSIDTIKDRVELRDKVYKARADNALLPNLLTKDFDIIQNSQSCYLTDEDIICEKSFSLDDMNGSLGYCIGGVDLSDTIDLTCATALFKLPDDPTLFVHQMYWIPERLFIEHCKSDNVPYALWRDQGWLRTCPGNRIDYHQVSQWFLDLQEKYDLYLWKCGYDRWQASYLTMEMEQYFGAATMIPVAQGKKTLSIPMKNLKAELQSRNVNYNNNPVLHWCMLNTLADTDINGNIQPTKKRNEERIDGFASLLDAYTVYQEFQEDYNNTI